MKRYHFDFFFRALIAVSLFSANVHASTFETITLSDSMKEATVNMVAQETHDIYNSVPYQATCYNTEYRDEWKCHTNFESQCGNVYECHQRPVQYCERGASLFDFSIFSVAHAAEAEVMGKPPIKPNPERPDVPSPRPRPERPNKPDPRPDIPSPSPRPPTKPSPGKPDVPSPKPIKPTPYPEPPTSAPGEPAWPQPKPPHPEPPKPPVCYTKYEQVCGYEYQCHQVPVEKCGYESVPYQVPYACTKYKDVYSHTEVDFNVQAQAHVSLAALERIEGVEEFQVSLKGTKIQIAQNTVSKRNLIFLTEKSSQVVTVKPDMGPKNPGLKQVAKEVEVGLIPAATLNSELSQNLSELKIQGSVLSFVIARSIYVDQLGLSLKLVSDKMFDKTLFNAAVPVAAMTVEKFGASARVSVDLAKLVNAKDAIKRKGKYKVTLETSAVFANDAKLLNPQLIKKSVRPEVKLKAL